MIPRSKQNRISEKVFVLGLAQEHNLALLHQKYDCYFFTININSRVGSEILFRQMLKCQSKKY